MIRAFLAVLLVLTSTACTKVHFAAPTARLEPGVEVTVKHAMVKRDFFYLVADVSNWTNRPLFMDLSFWRIQLPDGVQLTPRRKRSDKNWNQVWMDHGRKKTVKIVFEGQVLDAEYLPGAELIIAGMSDHPAALGGRLGQIRLERRD